MVLLTALLGFEPAADAGCPAASVMVGTVPFTIAAWSAHSCCRAAMAFFIMPTASAPSMAFSSPPPSPSNRFTLIATAADLRSRSPAACWSLSAAAARSDDMLRLPY